MRLAAVTLGILVATTSFGMTRLIAVVDRNQGDVGTGCNATFDALKKFLRKASEENRADFNVFEFEDRAGNVITPTPDLVLRQLEASKFDANDVLWFYYCGHGRKTPEGEHVLEISTGDLSREELVTVLESKKTRAVILTTDMCSSPGDPLDKPRIVGSGAPTPELDHWTVLKNLFDNSSGTVDFTAATGTGRAFIDPEGGAIFTDALLFVLGAKPWDQDLNGDRKVEWEEIFAQVRQQTRKSFAWMQARAPQSLSTVRLTGDDKEQTPFLSAIGKKEEELKTEHVRVPYVLQSYPVQDTAGELGIMFNIKTQFHPYYNGRTVLLYLSFEDGFGRPVRLTEGEGTLDRISVRLDANTIRPNDNNPWQFYIRDRTLRGEKLSVNLAIWDYTDPAAPKSIFQKKSALVDRTGFGAPAPRPE